MSNQLSDSGPSTREKIIEAARELFFDQGYASTGLAQIVSKAGVKTGSLYYFFPTKEDLLNAVLEKYRDMLMPAVIQPALARASDPIDRIFAILYGYRVLLEMTEFRLGCPIGNLALEVSNGYPNVRKLIEENFEGWRQAVLLQLTAASDRFPEDVQIVDLSHHILATMEGAVMLSRSYHSFEPFDAAISSLRSYLECLSTAGTNWAAPKNHQEEKP